MLILFALLLKIVALSAFDGLDCNNPAVSQIFAANKIQQCQLTYPKKINFLGSRTLTLVQSDRLIMAPVRKCKLQYRAHIFNCGNFGDHVIEAGAFPSIKSITEDECKKAFESKTIHLLNGKYLGELKTGITVGSVNIYGGANTHGSCEADSVFQFNGKSYSANMVWHVKFEMLETNEIFNVEKKTLVSTGDPCDLSDSKCTSDGYTILPQKQTTKEACAYSTIREVIFNVYWADPLPIGVQATTELSDLRYRLLTSKDPKTMLRLLTSEGTTLCGHTAAITNFKGYFIIDKSQKQYFKKVTASDVRLPALSDSKLFYLFETRGEEQRKAYMELQLQICSNKRQIIRNKLQILRMLPPGQPGLISFDPPVVGIVMGEIIYMLKCRKVEVKLRATKTCFAEIPIMYGTTEMCMDPMSKIVQPSCRPIPCSTILKPAFFDMRGQWTSYGTKFASIHTPADYPINSSFSTLTWKSITTYEDGGLYNPDDVKDMLELLYQNKKIETVNSIMTDHAHLDNRGGITIDSDIIGIVLDKYKNKLMQVFKTIQKIGNFISSFFGFYIMILLIKYVFNRAVDFATFRKLMSAPLMCIALLCPSVVRYRTGVEMHRRYNRSDSEMGLSVYEQPGPSTQTQLPRQLPNCPEEKYKQNPK